MATHFSILAWRIHGQRSLAGYSPWGHKESHTTEATEHTHASENLDPTGEEHTHACLLPEQGKGSRLKLPRALAGSPQPPLCVPQPTMSPYSCPSCFNTPPLWNEGVNTGMGEMVPLEGT